MRRWWPRSLFGQLALLHVAIALAAAVTLPLAVGALLHRVARHYQHEVLHQQAQRVADRLSADQQRTRTLYFPLPAIEVAPPPEPVRQAAAPAPLPPPAPAPVQAVELPSSPPGVLDKSIKTVRGGREVPMPRKIIDAGAIYDPSIAPAGRQSIVILELTLDPDGQVANAKVLTIHALDDGLVLPENETKYRQAFEAAGRAEQLVQLTTARGGHCGFIAELFVAIPALTGWVERGEKPTTAALAAACPEPACSFTASEPGPWGLKVVEREQLGVATDSLVCTGLEGDCPAGTSCALADLHCGGS